MERNRQSIVIRSVALAGVLAFASVAVPVRVTGQAAPGANCQWPAPRADTLRASGWLTTGNWLPSPP